MTEQKRKSALIIVDVTTGFCPIAINGHEVIEVANYLTAKKGFTVKVFTQDWHPANHCSFFTNHPGKKMLDTIILESGVEQTLWPVHSVQDTDGAQFHPALAMKCDKIIQKGTDPKIDSYSAFFNNTKTNSTDLYNYLIENEITDLFVMGLSTEICVKFTVLDAINLGFTVYVIRDGCRAINNEDGEKAFKEMKDATANIITSDEIDI